MGPCHANAGGRIVHSSGESFLPELGGIIAPVPRRADDLYTVEVKTTNTWTRYDFKELEDGEELEDGQFDSVSVRRKKFRNASRRRS